MESVFVGTGYVALFVRGARTFKERRSVVQGIAQKLRNEGFSVSEMNFGEDPQKTALAFSLIGNTHGFVDKKFDGAIRLFEGPYYIVSKKKVITEWEVKEIEGFQNAEDEVYE
jgi:uncharacterized protein YlxP (DUF503 family)